jgi:hypothetical protein
MKSILETDIEELVDFIKENKLAQLFVDWKFRRKETNQSQETKTHKVGLEDEKQGSLDTTRNKNIRLVSAEMPVNKTPDTQCPNKSEGDVKLLTKQVQTGSEKIQEKKGENNVERNS